MNDFSLREWEALTTILGSENSNDLIKKLLAEYCINYPNKTPELIDFTNALIKMQLLTNNRQLINYDDTMKMLIASKSKTNQVKDKFSFITAIGVCKIHFPDGDASRHSEGERRYFNDFVNYPKDHKEEYIDDEWSIDYGHNKYLKMVLEKN